MKRKFYILGSGGHSRSVINLLELNKLSIAGIFDESFKINTPEEICGYKLLGKPSDIPLDGKIILAIGDNLKRFSAWQTLSSRIYSNTIVHPKAIIEKRIKFGHSNLVFAKAYINTHASIGDNNLINTGAIIEHEAAVGSHNHISVGSIICGRVLIGDACFIGAGSVIIDHVKICDQVTIGANSVVIDNITQSGIYAGNPARRIR